MSLPYEDKDRTWLEQRLFTVDGLGSKEKRFIFDELIRRRADVGKWISKPTHDGHWWVKSRGQLSGKEYIHPVSVYNNLDTVFSDGENFSLDCDMFIEWFSVPITEPN